MNDQKKIVDVFTLLKPEIEKLKNAGSDTSALDCRILLAHAMSLEKAIYTHQSINISEHQITNFKELIAEREMGKPVSRITTKKNFWTKEFEINEETLDPRPDSEIIIDYELLNGKEFSSQLLYVVSNVYAASCR